MGSQDDRGESEWLARAGEGDDQAFAKLVEAYQMPVHNLCFRMLGDAGEAEDASQESFLRAYRSLHRYDPQRKFSTWLLSIASHYCIDQLRRRKVPAVSLDEVEPWEEAPDPLPGPEAALVGREEQASLNRMLGSLRSQDRAAILLRYWYGLSTEEIAASLSLSVKAVKSRLHRARKALAQDWTMRQTSVLPAGGEHGRAPAL
jgi:RNA polymerase sigma-70 factor (ECF subfamily)